MQKEVVVVMYFVGALDYNKHDENIDLLNLVEGRGVGGLSVVFTYTLCCLASVFLFFLAL